MQIYLPSFAHLVTKKGKQIQFESRFSISFDSCLKARLLSHRINTSIVVIYSQIKIGKYQSSAKVNFATRIVDKPTKNFFM